MNNQPQHPCTAIIGRDASEVTKRKVPHFPVKLKTTKTRHIGFMYHIECLTVLFK